MNVKDRSGALPYLAGLTLLAASTMTTAADPGDGKVYSGLGCKEVPNGSYLAPNPEQYFDNVRHTSPGWAYNSNFDKSILVACPIVRERVETPMKRAFVTVLNQTDTEVVCEIEAFDPEGTAIEQSSPMHFKKSWDGHPTTALVSNDPSDDDAWPNSDYAWAPQQKNASGFYMLYCSMPPMTKDQNGVKGAYIVRYQIDELAP